MKTIDSWIIYRYSPSQPYLTLHDIMFDLDAVNELCSSKGFYSYCSKAYRLKINEDKESQDQ